MKSKAFFRLTAPLFTRSSRDPSTTFEQLNHQQNTNNQLMAHSNKYNNNTNAMYEQQSASASAPNSSAATATTTSSAALTQQQQQQLVFAQEFWEEQILAAEQFDSDFKNHPLPLARIKKVMKSDPEVKVRHSSPPLPVPLLSAPVPPVFLSNSIESAFLQFLHPCFLFLQSSLRRSFLYSPFLNDCASFLICKRDR